MILVTGGAGFIGRHLIALLALGGMRGIRALSRSPGRLLAGAEGTIQVALRAAEHLALAGRLGSEALAGARERARRGAALLREAVEPIAADVRDAEALRRAMEEMEAVVHTIAIIRETEGRTLQGINVEATRRVVGAARQAGVRRFLYMGILGATDDPRLPYARSRWLGEQAVLESGLDYTVLKPSLVLGVADTFSVRLLQALDFAPPLVALPDGGRARFQPLWVGDMAAILALCLQDPRTVGRSYELGGPQYVTLAELMRRAARHLGKRRLFVPVPAPLLWPGVWATMRLLRDPPVTFDELKQLRVDDYTALDAVTRNFGFEPLPLDDHFDYIREVAALRRRGPVAG